MKRTMLKLIFTVFFSLWFYTSCKAADPVKVEFFKSHPELADASTLSMFVDKSVKKPKRPYLGAFGIGGLNAFTLMGLSYPFNTYHNTTTYYWPFFGDTSVGLETAGVKIEFPKESIWYVRDTAIAVTEEKNDKLAMFTVNLSPPESGAFIRIVVVRANEDSNNLRVFADIAGGSENTETELKQVRDTGARTRTLTIGSLDGGARTEAGRLVIDIPSLKKDEEQVFYLYYLIQTGENADPAAAVSNLKKGREKLILQTLDYWKVFLSGSTKIITPDQRLNDMLENLKIAQKIQMNANGAEVVTVKYADRSHDRENVHVTRYYLMMGMPEVAKQIMMYGFYASQIQGSILNSQAADLDISSLPPTVDWDKMPLDNTDPNRHAAERPSWTVLQFARYYEYTGDIETIKQVYPYLRRNIFGQEISQEGLLPFSGDEMYQITYPTYVSGAPLEKFYSLDSSIAFVAAARGLENIAEKLGEENDVAKIRELADRVEAAIEKYYWMEDAGYYATGLRKSDLSRMDKMFPLITLNFDVAGYAVKGDSELANENILHRTKDGEAMSAALLQKDGSLKMARGAGMYHGQLQGMFLFYLKHANPLLAGKVFHLLIDKISDPAGMFSEVHMNNHSHLSMHVDTSGLTKEDARRFGPWESTLNMASLVNYLTGMSVDADKMTVFLSPEMPENWKHWELRDGKVGKNNFDFFIDDDGHAITYRFVNKGSGMININIAPFKRRLDRHRIFVNGKLMDLCSNGNELCNVDVIQPVEKEIEIKAEYHSQDAGK
jgi:hypothetical protein